MPQLSNAELLRRNIYTLMTYRGFSRLEDMVDDAGSCRRDFSRKTCQIGRWADIAEHLGIPLYALFEERFAKYMDEPFAEEHLVINPTVNQLIRYKANLGAMEEEAERLGVTLPDLLHPDFIED